MFAVTSVIKQDLPYLEEIYISGYTLSEKSIDYLSESLNFTNHIKKVTISSMDFNYNSLRSLTSCVKSSQTIEYLDLSNNNFRDSYSDLLCSLFVSKLKILILDRNNFEDSVFAEELTKNTELLHFSISYNPLKYGSVIRLLEALTENKSLQYLGLLGIKFKGAAPIKENSSGLLDAQEAIVLKLAYVLRSSHLSSLGLDISPDCTIQLKELENSLLKYNRFLQSIESKYIEWSSVQKESPLFNIYLAMKANKWNSKSDLSLPPGELKEILKIKEAFSSGGFDDNRFKASSKSSLVNFHEDFDEEKADKTHTPQFSLGDKNFNEFTSFKNNTLESTTQSDKFSAFFDKLLERFNDIELKVLKKLDTFEKKLEISEEHNRKKQDDVRSISKTLANLQERVDEIEKVLKSKNLAENSIKALESLRFTTPKNFSLEATKVDSSKIEESVKQLLKRMKNVEQKSAETNLEKTLITKFSGFEDRLNQIEKFSDNFASLNRNFNQTAKKIKKLEEIMNFGTETPAKAIEHPSIMSSVGKNRLKNSKHEQSKGNNLNTSIGEECESVILGALLERVNNSFRGSPERPASAFATQKKYARAPSTDLKESLRLKGFMIDSKQGLSPGVYKRSFKHFNE